MSAGWEVDKKWSDRFLPQIKRELGEFLLAEPHVDEDQQRNTDLIVLKMDSTRIACRIRKNDVFANSQYRNEFTIREGRPSGQRTELSKIIEGWGDFLFYGFCDEKQQSLVAWRIIALGEFRLWFNREIVRNKGNIPGIGKPNKDGSSTFRAFNCKDMPDCVAKSFGFDVKLELIPA